MEQLDSALSVRRPRWNYRIPLDVKMMHKTTCSGGNWLPGQLTEALVGYKCGETIGVGAQSRVVMTSVVSSCR